MVRATAYRFSPGTLLEIGLSAFDTSHPGYGVARLDEPSRVLGLPWPLAACIALQLLAWTVIPTAATTAIDPATMQLGMWGREFGLVQAGHPALASWALDLAYALFGVHKWVSYGTAEVFLAGATVCIYLAGRVLLDEARAVAAAMPVAGLGAAAIAFDSRLAMLPFAAAFVFALWQAVETDRARWWIFAAVAAGLGLYADLAMGLTLASGALWILGDAEARGRFKAGTPYPGVGLLLLFAAPLMVALIRALGATASPASLRDLGIALASMAAVAVIGGAVGLRAKPAAERVARRRRVYLVLIGLVPAVILHDVASLPLLGLALLGLWPRATSRSGPRMLAAAAAVTLMLAAGFGWQQYRNFAVGSAPTVFSYPMGHIAHRFEKVWHRATGVPLEIVAGDPGTAALVGLKAQDFPTMFADLDPRQSPGVTPERIARDGMLVVWRDGDAWTPPPALIAGRATGNVWIRWSKTSPNAARIPFRYAIIPPQVSRQDFR